MDCGISRNLRISTVKTSQGISYQVRPKFLGVMVFVASLSPIWDSIDNDYGGGQRVGDWEKKGQEVYGRREKRGQEVGFPRWREVGEKGKIMQHCTIFCNQENANRWEPTNTGREPGLQSTGSGRFEPPCPSVPLPMIE